MLEKIDLKKDLDKENYKAIMEEADAKLGRLQRACKDKGIPIIILCHAPFATPYCMEEMR